MIFGYTRFLEKENSDLKARAETLEKRNHELVLELFRRNLQLPEQAIAKKQHKIDRVSETKVSCTCGWSFSADDPVNIQYAITEHYRQDVVSPTHRKWSQTRDAMERQAEIEARQEEHKRQEKVS